MSDLISRKWLIECVEEGWIKFKTEKDENRFIHLVRDIAPSAQPEYTEQDVRDSFNSGYACGMEAVQPETEEGRFLQPS